ncbi:MAG: hypothetical protein U9O20_03305 [Patescibacteria group bacterium]|nr:hypothetical protein [Patescibacteria group bacterium]
MAKQKQKQKKDIKDVLKEIKKKCPRFILDTWYFTVIFFLTAFSGSMWVWWSCYYSPTPSKNVLISFETKKEDFDSMKKRTQMAIELLQGKLDKYKNVPDLSQQRELFKVKVEVEEIEPAESEPIVVPSGEVKVEETHEVNPQPSQ